MWIIGSCRSGRLIGWSRRPQTMPRISEEPSMHIQRSGTQASIKGPGDWFSGDVRIDPLFTAAAPARVACASVTFEPGARSAWHTHPLGQVLVVTAGCGWTQCEGGPIEEIRHWHGATPTTAMTHIAIQ